MVTDEEESGRKEEQSMRNENQGGSCSAQLWKMWQTGATVLSLHATVHSVR